jgi:hypothetical protein
MAQPAHDRPVRKVAELGAMRRVESARRSREGAREGGFILDRSGYYHNEGSSSRQ